ncbi:MAG: PAS domain-containing protein [Methanoregula sp.]|nr:PAS domain-containing protein [Methanoregula sp.]
MIAANDLGETLTSLGYQIAGTARSGENAIENVLAALIESETRYRMIGDLIPFGVWACDAKGNFTYLSASFLSVLNITLEECRKTGWMHLLPREDYDRTIADWRQCIQTASFWDYEYRIADPSGKIFIVLSRGAPHMDSAGNIINELVTNSLKYAFAGRETGNLSLCCIIRKIIPSVLPCAMMAEACLWISKLAAGQVSGYSSYGCLSTSSVAG